MSTALKHWKRTIDSAAAGLTPAESITAAESTAAASTTAAAPSTPAASTPTTPKYETVSKWVRAQHIKGQTGNVTMTLELLEHSSQYRLTLVEDPCPSQTLADMILNRTTIPHQDYHLGSNEYLVQFEGPELHAMIPEHQGNCIYQTHWTVSNKQPGQYQLRVTNHRPSYTAIREDERKWPPIYFDRLLQVAVKVNGTTTTKTTSCNSPDGSAAGAGVWTRVHPSSDNKEAVHVQVKQRSRWVATHVDLTGGAGARTPAFQSLPSQKEMDAHRVPNANRRKEAIKLFSPTKQEMTTYRYQMCHDDNDNDGSTTTNSNSNDNDWRQHSILFSGDSNSRAAFMDLTLMLGLAHKASDYRQMNEGDYCVQFESTHKQWCVVNNPFGDCATLVQAQKKYSSDLVVWNFGQHHAAKKKSSFATYSTKVTEAVQCAKKELQQSHKNVTLFWMSSPPVSLRDDVYVRKFADWRTLDRMCAFNRFANRAFAQAGFAVVDQFQSMLPLIDKCEDDAHYSYFRTHQLLAQVLAKQLHISYNY